MTRIAHVVGVDPGLVHTGCVRLVFDSWSRQLTLDHAVIDGPDAQAVRTWITDTTDLPFSVVFIEDYRPRHNLSPDKRMVEAVAEMKRVNLGSTVVSNMGITRVVPTQLMNLLGVWDWPQSTHHQDLRSAARIALLGMMKNPALNVMLSATVRDHLAGLTWEVVRA